MSLMRLQTVGLTKGPSGAAAKRRRRRADLPRPAAPCPLHASFMPADSSGLEQPLPSVLRGLIVRLKYAGSYHLLPVEQLVTAARGLAVASPETQQPAALLRVQLSSASGTNTLADGQWEAAGRAEVEQLAALLQRRGSILPAEQVRQTVCGGW